MYTNRDTIKLIDIMQLAIVVGIVIIGLLYAHDYDVQQRLAEANTTSFEEEVNEDIMYLNHKVSVQQDQIEALQLHILKQSSK